ncbi:MAG: ribosome recycling factor [Gammaproteobacteria bacterium]|nr:ribosome recycling factor [Gammaproteobacteria bacterium]
MIDDVIKDARDRMDKSLESLKHELAKIRTGRAHPSLLEHVTISYYGAETALNHAASINVTDARTLSVTPFDKSMVGEIEKAIRDSDLGLNPATVGETIRVPLPALTEERRKELIKVVRHEAEQARVAVRNIRRDANQTLKELTREKEITEDDERRAEERVQKLTDDHIAGIDKLLEQKEQDLLEV